MQLCRLPFFSDPDSSPFSQSAFIAIIQLDSIELRGQDCGDYKPLATYNSRGDKEVVDSVRRRMRLSPPRGEDDLSTWFLYSLNKKRIQAVERMFEQNKIVKDPEIEGYVNKVMGRINQGIIENPRVFILNSPYVNAKNFGDGILVVTTGLLARCYNEDQLAFVLAHEIAHDKLKHVNDRMRRIAELKKEKRNKQQIILILTDEKLLKDIQEQKRLYYQLANNSREQEGEADSLGFLLLSNAGYSPHEAITMLDILEKSDSMKYDIGIDLFMPLHSRDYPFQDKWLNPRLSVYRGEIANDEMAMYDSARSHPAIHERKEFLRHMPSFPAIGTFPSTVLPQLNKVAFEIVETAIKDRMYDRALFHALQLLHRHPCNSFLVTRISGILLKLSALEDKMAINIYVPRYTFGYSNDLRFINNMLHNMSQNEMSEVAYYMLKNKAYFNQDNRNHYYLMERICNLTYREEEASQMRKLYKAKFNEPISAGNPEHQLILD